MGEGHRITIEEEDNDYDLRAKVEGRSPMAGVSSKGGAKGASGDKGGEGKRSIKSVEVDKRRNEGFYKEIKRVKILERNKFSLIIIKS